VLAPEEQLRRRLRQLGRTWPRYGYRRMWALLRQEGWRVNRKRVQRIWREEGLRVPAQAPKRRRLGISTVPAARLRAERPNHVWALDFIFDATSDGRPLRALSMCDEFTRENLARRIGRSITADAVVDALDEAYAERGARSSSVATTVLSWWPWRSGTGAASWAPGPPTLHRTRQPLGEPVRGELQQQAPRRALRPRGLRQRHGGADPLRRLGRHLQPAPPHTALGYLAPAVFAAAWNSRKTGSEQLPSATAATTGGGIKSPEPS
jgi:putative transposase